MADVIHWVLLVLWALVSLWFLWFAWCTKEPIFGLIALLDGLVSLGIGMGIGLK